MSKTKMDTLHVAMRTGTYQEQELGKDVITAHNDIVNAHGRACLGKVGRGFAANKLNRLRRSLEDGGHCSLIMIRKKKTRYELFAAPLVAIPDQDNVPDLRLVPAYYHDLVGEIRLWLEIQEFVRQGDDFIDRLALDSNSKQLRETLGTCRTSLMLVREGEAS